MGSRSSHHQRLVALMMATATAMMLCYAGHTALTNALRRRMVVEDACVIVRGAGKVETRNQGTFDLTDANGLYVRTDLYQVAPEGFPSPGLYSKLLHNCHDDTYHFYLKNDAPKAYIYLSWRGTWNICLPDVNSTYSCSRVGKQSRPPSKGWRFQGKLSEDLQLEFSQQ